MLERKMFFAMICSTWVEVKMMDKGISGKKSDIAAESSLSEINENAHRGDYFFLGFIGILLAGVVAYLMLNPEESGLRDGVVIERGSVYHEPVTSHAVVHETATSEPVESAAATAEVAKPEAAKPEVVKPEVTKPEVTKPEVAKPEVAKPEVTKPEVAKPKESQPTITSVPRHENSPQTNRTAWAVNLVSFARLDSARKAMAQLKAEGVTTEFIEVKTGGHTYYRVRIPGLASRQEAASLRAEFVNRPEFAGVWIASYRQ
ncbi:MAG: SPOR domain-containing protein [Mariprofundus sp.]